jgi:hypothetical protein
MAAVVVGLACVAQARADSAPVDLQVIDRESGEPPPLPAGPTTWKPSCNTAPPSTPRTPRGHGASLDRKNHAGESARDMARASGDAELDQAVGSSP